MEYLNSNYPETGKVFREEADIKDDDYKGVSI